MENKEEGKRGPGQPKKAKTVTPGLRIEAELWAKFKAKYPGQINQMFLDWVKQQT